MQYRVEIFVVHEDGDDEAGITVTCHDVGDSPEDRSKIALAVERAAWILRNYDVQNRARMN